MQLYLLLGGLLASIETACTREDSASRPSLNGATLAVGPSAARPRPAVSQRVHSVGQRVERLAYAARVARVIECTAERGSGPQPDHVLLGVELEVSSADSSVAIGHSHAKLVDASGTRYDALPVPKTKDCTPLLRYSRLAANEAERGWLVFHVPVRARSLTLSLGPRLYLNETPTLFTLGR